MYVGPVRLCAMGGTCVNHSIGAPLLSWKRGHVRPTAIGEVLVERARRLFADAEQALDDIQRQVQGLEGRARLGASTGATARLLPQALEFGVRRARHATCT